MFAAAGYAAMYSADARPGYAALWAMGLPCLVPMGTYDCQDGRIMLVVGNDRQYARFCEALDRPDLASDPRYGSIADRLANRVVLEAEVVNALRARPREDWVTALRAAGVPAGAVRTPKEAVASPKALPPAAVPIGNVSSNRNQLNATRSPTSKSSMVRTKPSNTLPDPNTSAPNAAELVPAPPSTAVSPVSSVKPPAIGTRSLGKIPPGADAPIRSRFGMAVPPLHDTAVADDPATVQSLSNA